MTTVTGRLRTMVVVVLVCGASAARADGPVIPPGHEEAVRAMLEAPAGCALSGIAIDRDRIDARYECGDGAVSVSLHHIRAAPGEAERAGDFGVVFDGPWPEAARAAVTARIAQRAPPDLWVAPESRGPDGARRATGGPALARAVLVLALLLAILGAALRGARRVPLAAAEPVALGPAAVAIAGAAAALVWGAYRFRFAYDDFTKLLLADVAPFAPDAELRLVGLRAPFALAAALGSAPAVFAVMNVLVVLAWIGLMAALLRRAGVALPLALAGAAIGACSSYQLGLVRWAVGIQHLIVWVWVLAAILAFDDAARQTDPRRCAGALLLGAAAALAAVLSKYPVAVVIPIMTYGWCRFVAADTSSPLRAPWFHLALAVVVAVPVAVARATLTSNEPAVAEMGLAAVPGNLAELLGRGHALALLLVAWAGARIATGRARARPPRAAIAMSVLAAAALAPFLLNGAYFADYYPAGLYAWLAAAMVVDLAPGLRAPRGAARAAVFVWAVAVWPWHGVHATVRASPDNEVTAFLTGARDALRDTAQPALLVVDPGCPDAHLDDMMMAAGGGDGLRWITGWRDTRVTTAYEGGGDDIVYLTWCPDHRPAWSVHGR